MLEIRENQIQNMKLHHFSYTILLNCNTLVWLWHKDLWIPLWRGYRNRLFFVRISQLIRCIPLLIPQHLSVIWGCWGTEAELAGTTLHNSKHWIYSIIWCEGFRGCDGGKITTRGQRGQMIKEWDGMLGIRVPILGLPLCLLWVEDIITKPFLQNSRIS